MGGQNPLIILRDADIDAAVNAAAFGGFLHQGQICMSTRRIIVEAPVAHEFVEKLVKKVSSFKVGDPKEPDTIIGPLINRHRLGKVRNSVEAAVRDGARSAAVKRRDRAITRPYSPTSRPAPLSRARRHSALSSR